MSTRKKPGRDTLVFFWTAVVLGTLGALIPSLGARVLGLNLETLVMLQMVSALLFVTAGILGLVVVHKVIAMLMYLVHHKP